MVIGHTPVDSAFTTYGLLGAGRVLDMLLSLPVLALVFIIALIGLYKAIALSATRASAAPFWTFLVLNVGAFFFFSAVTPLSVGDVQSAAKAAGAKERRTTAEDFPAGAESSGNTSGGLLLIVRAINGVMFRPVLILGSAPLARSSRITSTSADLAANSNAVAPTRRRRRCYGWRASRATSRRSCNALSRRVSSPVSTSRGSRRSTQSSRSTQRSSARR